MNSIRVAVIGCGRMGHRHATAIRRLKTIKLVGCTDVIKEKSEQLAKTFKIKSYKFDDMLEDKNIDAVLVCTPNSSHKYYVVEGLKSDKHVLVEKPLAMNAKECNEIIAYSRKKPHLKIMVGHTHRFYPYNIMVKQLIECGKIGRIRSIFEHNIDPGIISGKGGIPRWVFEKTVGGGVLMDMVHIIDKARWLTGSEIKSVYAPLIDNESANSPNMGSIVFSLTNSVVVQLFFLSPSWGIRSQLTQIVGTKGVIQSAYGESVALGTKNWKEFDFYGRNSPPIFEHNLKGFENELRAFAYSIINDKESPVTLKDGKKAVEVIKAIEDSYRKKVVVNIK